ncbi:hypothetical protein HYALB_00003913 [Hymenoscyphus albidus]|uniref:Uncharacterized protein n=1 Tax=Hymenoscyphus albidus TaxID=595503 RepID=A0A9N9Q9P8_9HELO|nr:hypothetical protein HYALB_00003913 [Hymenoscyphus albidus]
MGISLSKNPQTQVAKTFDNLWQLSRFHTRESWLAVFPAIWGLAFTVNQSHTNLPSSQLHLILSNWFCMTLFHGTFCTWNDVCDVNFDKQVARTKNRPLAAGRCSIQTAVIWFITQWVITDFLVYTLLGAPALKVFHPWCFIATIYPFMKRLVSWPQFILAPAVAGPSFVGWSSINGNSNIEGALPLFIAYSIWTVYFDTAYGFQDINDDKKAGVGSLAQFLGPNFIKPFLAVTGAVTIGLLGIAATRAQFTLLFWILGLGIWAASLPFQFNMLDLNDSKSGGKVFGFNIKLGLYISFIALTEAGMKFVR